MTNKQLQPRMFEYIKAELRHIVEALLLNNGFIKISSQSRSDIHSPNYTLN